MIRVLIIALLILGFIGFMNYFLKSDYGKKQKIIKVILFLLLILGLVALVVTGKLHWLAAIGGSLVPLVPKVISWMAKNTTLIQSIFKKSKHKTTKNTLHGNQSTVVTQYLKMVLDHDTGRMDGEVISGEYAGKKLSELLLSELREMTKKFDDDESVSLLMAYMDRYHRRGTQDTEVQVDKNEEITDFMSIHEAREILGLEEGAKKDEVIEAHKRLIQKIHPDNGGSEYLATKINKAKEVLLSAV